MTVLRLKSACAMRIFLSFYSFLLSLLHFVDNKLLTYNYSAMHWSLFSTYWRYTNKIIFIIIIFIIIILSTILKIEVFK